MGAPGRFGGVFFGSLRGYRRTWLWPDLVAGLTVWAILVPESLAYAVLAGVPPVVGLWAAPAALVLYAVLGSSRHLVVGPMSATSALSGVAVLLDRMNSNVTTTARSPRRRGTAVPGSIRPGSIRGCALPSPTCC